MKIPMLRRVVAGASTALAFLVLSVLPVGAQQSGNGFRISPVRSEFTIEKGASESLEMTLENPADVATTARAIVNDFVASDKEDGEPRLILDDNTPPPKNSFKTLVQPIPDVDLGPREKKNINVTISVPENANSGGYYGAIRFAPVNTSQEAGNVGLTASVGSIVLVRVPGDLTERLDLLSLSAGQDGNAKSLISNGKVQVLTRLKNEGDIHLKPFGTYTVKNMFGKVIHQGEFNSGETEADRANILPGSTRKFVNELGDKKLLGRYTIEANLGYVQGGGDLISAKATFWYLPIWSMVVIALVLLAIIGGIYWLYRKFAGKPRHGIKR